MSCSIVVPERGQPMTKMGRSGRMLSTLFTIVYTPVKNGSVRTCRSPSGPEAACAGSGATARVDCHMR
ncbi:hypothetical protein Sme01_43240 [Sphaerisporangium melleum]|uniref:Uncharacterized protein n=1 Tax=Sphaerisporangium melleum TaxID=321316 RepID=A0A917VH05_9ACTN|nr:hypothetical protein GCM10007964_20200 [Sphaerisporangium melleum]GII71848.1 hypothetical protein Sme01_43240 [Sphaerisporangium melleum]